NDLALLRLLLGSVGNDDAAFGCVDAAHKHAVVQGTKLGLGHGLLAALAARFVARKVSIFQPSSTHQKRVPTAVWEILSLQLGVKVRNIKLGSYSPAGARLRCSPLPSKVVRLLCKEPE